MKLSVKQIKKEFQSYISFIFEKPKGFKFYSGQYLDINLNGDNRTFTISSSPSENYLMLTTKKGFSSFKSKLFSLKPGETIDTSHPAGTFILDETSPAIFIAGGIGITPFRSMIKHALDQKIKTPITLIYSNSDDNFLFKDELDEWKYHLPNLNIIYHNSSKNGRLTRLLTSHFSLPTSHFPLLTSIYYLAGPPSFVDDMAKILLESGTEPLNIRYDRFDGY